MFTKPLLNSTVFGLDHILEGLSDELISESRTSLIWIYIVFAYYYTILSSLGIFFKLNIHFDLLMIQNYVEVDFNCILICLMCTTKDC